MVMVKIIILIFFLFCFGDAAYFTITDVKLTISIHNKLLPSDRPVITMFARDFGSKNGTFLRYSINETNGYLHVYPPRGDVLFTNDFHQGKGVGSISATVSVDSVEGKNDTHLMVNVVPMDIFDCDVIVEDLCYFEEANYRIMEEENPTIIGPLASSYVWELCPKYKLTYNMPENSLLKLHPPTDTGKYWSLGTSRPLNREKDGYSTNIKITCVAENEQGTERKLERIIFLDILDVDNNAPYPQDQDKHFNLTSRVYKKGNRIDAQAIFLDVDSENVNNFEATILGSAQAQLFRTDCKSRPDDRNNKSRTIYYCDLVFLKDKHFMEDDYSVMILLNDTTLVKKNVKSANMTIHFHFNTQPANMKIRRLYPRKDIKVFRTAGPLARITQPTDPTGCTQFNMVEKNTRDIFNITRDGIVFVHSVENLRNAPEFVHLNVTWTKNGKVEYDELPVRIVDESSKSCEGIGSSTADWAICSESKSAHECLNSSLCAIATGGAESVRTRNNSERCMWRGDKNPGNEETHLYATCTPDSSTCPDGKCDSLEELNRNICPQDCTYDVLFPTKRGASGRGIDSATGVCTCNRSARCSCDKWKPKKKGKKTTTTTTTLGPIVVETNKQTGPENSRQSVLGANLSKCGTPCVLGIIAGTLFLTGAVALVVICWRLDRVNKAVRGKYSDESQDITAPLSDYVDRNNQNEPMSLNFHMTTSLADAATRNIINKYGPDPKWEFPRTQLVIEQTLGEGEFGRVLRAKALNIAGQKGHTVVAVKTLKDDARESELNDLLSEYQLLKEVSHLNVIKLLGVCTIPGGPVYLIIEFAEHGSLRNYLRRSRHIKSESLRLPSSLVIEEPAEIHYDEPNECKVTPKEILSFAWQISNGMAYLSDIKLVHRDLAARNVLLTKDKVCKISDFGLTRDIYEDNAYFKRSKGRVPVKWMAPESLSDHIYTSKSDVWSYGILVWELVTLGATPYPGIAVQNLFHLIRQGYRMERPDNCSPALYKVMRSCWHPDPEGRPSFHELSKTWEKMLEDGNNYLDLSNNSIHNRSYFCSPFGLNDEENDYSPKENGINPLNYLTKSMSYEKCGASDKLINQNTEIEENISEILQNNNTKGYETPVKVPKLQTPDNECPTGYTDMQSGKIK